MTPRCHARVLALTLEFHIIVPHDSLHRGETRAHWYCYRGPLYPYLSICRLLYCANDQVGKPFDSAVAPDFTLPFSQTNFSLMPILTSAIRTDCFVFKYIPRYSWYFCSSVFDTHNGTFYFQLSHIDKNTNFPISSIIGKRWYNYVCLRFIYLFIFLIKKYCN